MFEKLRTKIFYYLIFAFCIPSINAQHLVDSLNQVVNDYYDQGEYNTAFEVQKKVIQFYREENNFRAYERSLKIATNLQYVDNYSNELIELFSAESKILKLSNPLKAGYLWSILAQYFYNIGDLENAIKFYEKSAAKLAVHQDTIDLPWVYYWLGQAIILGQADGIAANNIADEGLRIRNLKKIKNGTIDARLIGLKGWAHRFIDEEQALAYFEEALALTPDSKNHYFSFLEHSIRILINLKRYEEALTKCQIIKNKGEETAETHALIAQIYTGQGKFDDAISELKIAQKKYEENDDVGHSEYAKLFYFEAIANQAKKDYKEVIANSQTIYQNSIESYHASTEFDFPGLDFEKLNLWTYQALLIHGEALASIYLKTRDPIYYEGALEVYKRIFYEIENRRRLMPNWESKESFNNFIYTSYHQALLLLTDINEHDKNNRIKDQFLEIYDRSKSVLFREKILDESIRKVLGTSKYVIIGDSLQALIARLEIEESKFTVNSLRNEADSIKTVLFKTRQIWKKFVKEHYHDFYAEGQLTPIPLSVDLQQKLSASQGILGYHITEKDIIAFYLDSLNFHVHKKPKSVEFLATINNFRRHLSDWDLILDHNSESKEELKRMGQNLSNFLLGGIEIPKSITHVVVIPDGVLYDIPFELLSSDNSDFSLQIDYKISYSHSLSTMFNLSETQNEKFTSTFGGFAPTYNANCTYNSNTTIQNNTENITFRSTLVDIPEARQTVKQVAKNWGGDSWIDDKASKQNFFQNAASYQILHLGMHGQLDTISNKLSNLVFACGPDNLLHLREIQALHLRSDLVVLSACNTGVGNKIIGEGPMSLSRSFFYAGAKSNLISLWPVPDKQSAIIITAFYKFLAEGNTKSEALQLAKKAYLSQSSPLELHPAFWSGFVLFGSDSPIIPVSNSNLTFVLIGAGILFLGGILFFSLTSKKS